MAGSLSGLENLVSLHLCYNPRLTNLDEHFLMWREDDEDPELWPRLEEVNYLHAFAWLGAPCLLLI